MKLLILLTFMCGTFQCISCQDCSTSTDLVCSGSNVHICLNSNTDGHALMITCGEGLTCNIQNPADGCQSASVSDVDSSTTPRGICAHNNLTLSKSNCQSYHKCINGKMRTLTCPKNTCYSPTKAACVKGTCALGVCRR